MTFNTMRRIIYSSALIPIFIATVFFAHTAHALEAGDIDPSFFTGVPAGADDTIYTTTLQPDGKILISGEFTTYNGTTANSIARLNTDGTLDTTFTTGTGADSDVNTITLQPDGKILIGGSFTTYNGTANKYLLRLHPDGSIDTTFTTGTGTSGELYAVTLQPDGKILIGGNFITYNGTTVYRLARLNADGTLDTPFNNAGGGPNYYIINITLQPDGKMIVGGYFVRYSSVSARYIARVNSDGTRDDTFVSGSGVNLNVYAFAQQPDGKILVGGYFTTYSGVLANRIVRLNIDGTRDDTFTAGTAAQDGTVNTIALQPDGKILIGGGFYNYDGAFSRFIARLNPDGTRDTTFPVGNGASYTVNKILVQPDGKILLGGRFESFQGLTANFIVRLNADVTRDTTFVTGVGIGANNEIRTMLLQPDGKIIIAGDFTTYSGATANRIARLNADGTLDTAFTVGTGAEGSILTSALQPDGKILIGGYFTTYNGATANRIVRLNADGTRDTTFTTGTGANNNVHTIALQPDGKILIGGHFTSYSGTSINRIARLNTDGTLDTTFTVGTGVDSYVYAIAQQSDGKILVGGQFTIYNSAPVAFLTRLLDADLPSATHNLTLEVPSNLSLSCTQSEQTNDTTIEFGTLTPGTPLTQQLTCTTTTNSPNGYTLQTKRDDPDTTMDKTTDNTQNITDRTNWDPQNPNATLWQTNDTGLAFTVISSTANKDTQWWGTGTTKDDPNNKYAGFPQTAQTIVNYTQYNQNATITDIAYKLDIPTTQQAGIYDGTVTYQATVNP